MPRSIRSYQREIKELRSLLRQMLWVQPHYDDSPSCSYCGQQQHLHRDHCRASKLVAAWWPEDDRVRQDAVRKG